MTDESAAHVAATLISNAAERAATLVAQATSDAARLVADAGTSAASERSEILRLASRIDARTENVEKSVDKLLHAMFEGNGRPSVLARLATIEADVRWERRSIAAIIGVVLGLLGVNVKL